MIERRKGLYTKMVDSPFFCETLVNFWKCLISMYQCDKIIRSM